MTNAIRKTAGVLGVALMATQIIGATETPAVGFQGSSAAFEQAMPATPAQKEAVALLKQISLHAATAGRHAGTLESYARIGSQHHYQTHAAELNRLKDAVNTMGSDFRRLQELRQSALPWQQRVADRMEPMLIGMAGSTTEAFERLNQDRRMMPSQEYRDAIENVYTYAGQVNNLLSVNLDYAQAREKLNRLDVTPAETAARVLPAQEGARSDVASKSLEQRVKSELLKLPYYGVFDYLAFQVTGDRVTLSGQVSGPVLKADAERIVRRVEGVGAVDSKIEVLPLSPNDNSIRLAAYRAIYGHSTLSRYGMNPHPPIRIIVNNGNLVLMGVVGSDMDRTIAGMQAGSVSGAFSVTNHLQVGI